jgi:hypothetical protein
VRELLGWNADRGCWYEAEFDDDGTVHIETLQDIEPVLERIQAKRDSGYIDRGIKKSWWHYATIPAEVELELRKKGINMYNKDQTNELLKEIDENYPKLKNTYKKHRVNLS